MTMPAGDLRRQSQRDAFPHTRRPLPWILAAFLAMLFLVPVDSTQANVHLPFDSKIDRFAVVLLIGAWIFFGGDQRSVWRSNRSKLYVGAAWLFLAVLVTGLIADSTRVINLGEWNL